MIPLTVCETLNRQLYLDLTDCACSAYSAEERKPYSFTHDMYLKRRNFLTHLGPEFYAIIIPKPPEGRRDIIKQIYPLTIRTTFGELHNWVSVPYCMLPPADRYEDSHILAQLPQMPEVERPSASWEWYCRKAGFEALGLRPGGWSEDPQLDWEEKMLGRDDLYWGCPIWDAGKLR
jgi:hypothetical protein